MVICPAEAAVILERMNAAATACVSLDAGHSRAEVKRVGDGVELPDGSTVSLADLALIADNRDVLCSVDNGVVRRLMIYSEATCRTYKLRPTKDWPALEISGVLMHRIKGASPRLDARQKIDLLGPIRGRVIDTCFGLGYTAILAANTAETVLSVEKDAAVLELARMNPWSSEAFAGHRVHVMQGDSTEVIRKTESRSVDIIIHDPPTLSLAGDLYSEKLYAELARVLRRGGRVLHYTGSPGSRHRGISVSSGVMRRLRRVGFRKLSWHGEVGCVLGGL